MEIRVRKAMQTDWPMIKALVWVYPQELKRLNLTSYRSFFIAVLTEKRGKKTEEGEIVGCCAAAVMVLEDPADHRDPPKEVEIRSLAVKPGFEGYGVASALVLRCDKRRKELGIRQALAIASEGAKSIFERIGYITSDGRKHLLFRED